MLGTTRVVAKPERLSEALEGALFACCIFAWRNLLVFGRWMRHHEIVEIEADRPVSLTDLPLLKCTGDIEVLKKKRQLFGPGHLGQPLLKCKKFTDPDNHEFFFPGGHKFATKEEFTEFRTTKVADIAKYIRIDWFFFHVSALTYIRFYFPGTVDF